MERKGGKRRDLSCCFEKEGKEGKDQCGFGGKEGGKEEGKEG